MKTDKKELCSSTSSGFLAKVEFMIKAIVNSTACRCGGWPRRLGWWPQQRWTSRRSSSRGATSTTTLSTTWLSGSSFQLLGFFQARLTGTLIVAVVVLVRFKRRSFGWARNKWFDVFARFFMWRWHTSQLCRFLHLRTSGVLQQHLSRLRKVRGWD